MKVAIIPNRRGPLSPARPLNKHKGNGRMPLENWRSSNLGFAGCFIHTQAQTKKGFQFHVSVTPVSCGSYSPISLPIDIFLSLTNTMCPRNPKSFF